ncbi:MAG TPA: twin-arginine translocase TatA/TatE family subunit [Desulfuromonadaceae bacterium]|jgi:sec-independent protein translocase protein TatA
MFGFGMPEMFIILAILLVVAGPAKLPQLGQALGSSIRNFKKGCTGEDEPSPIEHKERPDSL